MEIEDQDQEEKEEVEEEEERDEVEEIEQAVRVVEEMMAKPTLEETTKNEGEEHLVI